MKRPRTCPNCNYQISFWKYLSKGKYWLVHAPFKCSNCGIELQVEHVRRINLIIMMVLWALLVNKINASFNFLEVNDLWLLFPIFIAGILCIWSLEAFKLVKPEEE